jgi:hypothetical protein
MRGLSKYEFAGPLTPQPMTLDHAKPAVIGGGIALAGAGVARITAPAGSFLSKHAGLTGAVAGAVAALATKQGGAGVASALLIGASVEIVEAFTAWKMAKE